MKPKFEVGDLCVIPNSLGYYCLIASIDEYYYNFVAISKLDGSDQGIGSVGIVEFDSYAVLEPEYAATRQFDEDLEKLLNE